MKRSPTSVMDYLRSRYKEFTSFEAERFSADSEVVIEAPGLVVQLGLALRARGCERPVLIKIRYGFVPPINNL